MFHAGESSPKRSKLNGLNNPVVFAEVTFDIGVVYGDKRNHAHDNVIKYAVALANSAGGVIRINEVTTDAKTVNKPRDIWLKTLEERLVKIMSQEVYKQCVHIVTNFPFTYLFVKKSKRVCSHKSGLKIPLQRSVDDASYEVIVNILNSGRVDVSQSESSSLELTEEEIVYDSDVPEATTILTVDEDNKVSFQESDTVQFKLINNGDATLEQLTKGIDNHLPKYISAFANHRGGNVYFGIGDDGTVKGQLVWGQEDKIKEMVENVIKREDVDRKMTRIWREPGFVPTYGQQWSVKFSPIKQGVSVIVVEIFSFKGGMFLEHPLAWKIEESSEQIVNMHFIEWKNMHSGDTGTYQYICVTICIIN